MEIRDVLINNSNLIRDNIVKHLMQMIEQNLFRPLPRPAQHNYNPEEDEPFLDPEYEHICKFAFQQPQSKAILALVYEIFVYFIESASFHPNQMKKHIDQAFIVKVSENFESQMFY